MFEEPCLTVYFQLLRKFSFTILGIFLFFYFRYLATQKNSFQAILTYNDEEAFLIANYYVLENAGATVAQIYDGCSHTFAPMFSSHNLQYTTNMGEPGRYVWSLHDVNCGDENSKT